MLYYNSQKLSSLLDQDIYRGSYFLRKLDDIGAFNHCYFYFVVEGSQYKNV